MRIALISETYLPFIAGVSTSTDSIARFMADRGHTVFLICPTPVLSEPEPQHPNIQIIHTPSVPDITYKGKPMTIFPLGFSAIYHVLTSESIDVVHVQEPGSLGVCAILAAKMTKKPIVGALHFTPEQVSRMVAGIPANIIIPATEKFIQAVYNRYHAIMVPTATFGTFLTRVGVTRPICIVSNGVDTNLYTPSQNKAAVRKKLSIAAHERVFLFIGRLDKDKNVQAIIRALPFTLPNTRVIISGSGKEEQSLKLLASELGVEKQITWNGYSDQQKMLDLYHSADCFIIMALYEVQSIVTLQALACGLPVIAAGAGALPELAQDGKNGFVVPPGNDKLLGEKINLIATNAPLRRQMGHISRTISLTHHKPTVLARLESLYHDTINAAV